MPVASAMTAVRRDCLVLASYAPWPEVYFVVSQGQIVSADHPYRTNNSNLSKIYNVGITKAYLHLSRMRFTNCILCLVTLGFFCIVVRFTITCSIHMQYHNNSAITYSTKLHDIEGYDYCSQRWVLLIIRCQYLTARSTCMTGGF